MLEYLNLRENEITELCPEINALAKLNSFNFIDNQLICLPQEIGALANLRYRELNNNGLSDLLKEIRKLTQLSDLEFSDNQFTSLPTEIGQLTEISMLDLSYNKLTNLPLEICNLAPSIELHLGNNYLDPKNLAKEVIVRANDFDPWWQETKNPTKIINNISNPYILTYSNTGNTLQFTIPTLHQLLIQIFNPQGRKVNEFHYNLRPGISSIDLRGIIPSSGAYYLKFTHNTISLGKRLF